MANNLKIVGINKKKQMQIGRKKVRKIKNAEGNIFTKRNGILHEIELFFKQVFSLHGQVTEIANKKILYQGLEEKKLLQQV